MALIVPDVFAHLRSTQNSWPSALRGVADGSARARFWGSVRGPAVAHLMSFT